MNNPHKISAVIITLNEEKNIERCIRSLQPVVDEVVVIDSYSKDRTEEICKSLNVRFIQQQWMGYGATKNFGHDQSSNEYILSIDADEELSPELQQSILSVKQNLNGVYSMNRLTNYCGKWIKYSGWYPDRKIRLFPKSKVMWNLEEVHESLDTKGLPEIVLKGDLYHYSYTSIFNHIDKSVHYGKLAGIHLHQSGKKPNWLKIIFSPWIRFLKDFFLRRGFMDGAYGFFIAITAAYSIFIKYFYHYQLRKDSEGK